MNKTLHILNGDATWHSFKQTALTGDVLVWREILSEGPVSTTELWPTRAKWISETYGENTTGYQQKVLAEIEKLNHLGPYNELVLWFEYDLLCQINLICILNILHESIGQLPSIYLICPDHFDGMPNFKGLGELNPEQLTSLWPSRTKLHQSDLTFASEAWQCYVENNPKQLENFLHRDFGQLPLLKKALQAHLLRFPQAPDGLNHIEKTLLEIVDSSKHAKPAIYQAFWEKEPIYGLADLQLEHILNQLQSKGKITATLTP
ncbi:DUF1835 domain-containing protein [Pedobacter sp. KR3-3]|uniref:DUF1835 domain-containing protein n=1 Tax=Pedobacter albus TaxID=3113905 RepID=A0ABU7IB57_9SPHI|nr:DUF1835 domain-containing protein [Pedobacter sp. KR3-3]MEE1946708.1 DUF1835 domain-containing protein [Pedobacter sp. KR3-3]